MIKSVFFILLFLYSLISIFYLFYVVFLKDFFLIQAKKLTLLALLLHTSLLGLLVLQWRMNILQNLEGIYLLSAWLLVLIYSIFNRQFNLKAVGTLVFPCVSLFFILDLPYLWDMQKAQFLLSSPWAALHIIFSFLSFSVLLLGFILAIVYLLAERQIKKKKKLFSWIIKFPPLEVLDNLHSKALSVGFTLLTFAIITASIWAHHIRKLLFYQDPRQMWTLCAWLIYALFLHGRYTSQWRGRKGLLISVIGFLVIVFTFMGVGHP